MEVKVQIQRGSKSLHHGHAPGVTRRAGVDADSPQPGGVLGERTPQDASRQLRTPSQQPTPSPRDSDIAVPATLIKRGFSPLVRLIGFVVRRKGLRRLSGGAISVQRRKTSPRCRLVMSLPSTLHLAPCTLHLNRFAPVDRQQLRRFLIAIRDPVKVAPAQP